MRLLTEMETFVQVAKLRHFGRAAASLGITASTLSRRIAALEKELGVVLIHRSTRSFALTPPGQIFFEKAESILEAAIATRDDLRASLTHVSGHLRVGAPSDLIAVLFGPVIARFCRANPGVSVHLISTPGQPDLKRDSLELGIVVAHQTRLADSSYAVHQLGSFSRRMFASRDYLKRNGIPKLPEDLQDHACIRYTGADPEKYWDLQGERKRQKIAVKGSYECNSVIAIAQAARGGLGIAMLADHLASHPSFGAGLIPVLPKWKGTQAFIFGLTANRVLPRSVAELIRASRTEFTKELARLESSSLLR